MTVRVLHIESHQHGFSIVELMMQAYFYSLYLVLGIFVPLIVTNCAILGRAEAFASKNNWDKALLDGLFMGIGFSIVLIILGALREVIGNGTLFNQLSLLVGSFDGFVLFENYQGALLAVLPPGAFIGLGLIIALKQALSAAFAQSNSSAPSTHPSAV